MPCFLPAVERKPRTLCGCQSVAFMSSARVAPLGRWIRAKILAVLLSARGAAALRAGFAAFFGVAALAVFLAFLVELGAPFFRLAPFFEEAFSGATYAPCSATAAAVVVVSALVI